MSGLILPTATLRASVERFVICWCIAAKTSASGYHVISDDSNWVGQLRTAGAVSEKSMRRASSWGDCQWSTREALETVLIPRESCIGIETLPCGLIDKRSCSANAVKAPSIFQQAPTPNPEPACPRTYSAIVCPWKRCTPPPFVVAKHEALLYWRLFHACSPRGGINADARHRYSRTRRSRHMSSVPRKTSVAIQDSRERTMANSCHCSARPSLRERSLANDRM